MFLRLILLILFLLNLPTYAEQKEISAELSKSEQSVWKVNYGDSFRGSGFFISPTLFVTNAHVVERSQPQTINLTHKDQTEVLSIKQLLAVDLKLDLALLEINETSSSHLLFREEPVNKDEELFILGYPSENFNILQKTGLLKNLSKEEHYFPVDILTVQGASGGPVLSAQGHITGVFWGNTKWGHIGWDGVKTIALTVSQKSVQKFINGESGVTCFNEEEQPIAFRDCFLKALVHLFIMADEGDPQAQHRAYNYNQKIEWLISAAEQGYAIAQYDLAFDYLYGTGIPQNIAKYFYWMEQSAQSGFSPAQHEFVKIQEKESQ